MKIRILVAAIIAVVSCAVYPITEQLAEAERGINTQVFGGEEVLLILGILAAICVIVDGLAKRKKKDGSIEATVHQTESEQSESNSL